MRSTGITEKISAFMAAQTPAMEAMLEAFVNQDSGSYDRGDVDALGDLLARELIAMGCAVMRHPAANAGYPLSGVCLPEGADPEVRRILLVGHRDTVFPAGTAATRPFTRDAGRFYGPGVADMKGGIVAGLFAMKAVLALREEIGPMPMEIVLTSDEEIGSSVSAPVVRERCKTAKAAFFLEPARANGAVVIGRDGGDLFRLDVYGKASHAGISFAEGVSAVNALARVITDIAALSDDAAGYSVNIGVIGGGSGAISVPAHAWGLGYTRYETMAQREFLLENIRRIVSQHSKGGIRIALEGPVGFLPFRANEANAAMFSTVQEAGAAFGLVLEGVVTRGAADAGLAAESGVPTICGMGPIGGNLHTEGEYLEAASLTERARVLALSMVLAAERFV